MKQIISILSQMQSVAASIELLEQDRCNIAAKGQAFGYTTAQIGDMVANSNVVINDLISRYRELSKQQFQLLREFEIRDAKPVSFDNLGVKPAGYANTTLNSQIIREHQNAA